MSKKLLILINKPIVLSWFITALNFSGFVFVLPVALTSLEEIDFSFWLFLGGVLAAGLILEIAGGLVFTRTLSFSVGGEHTVDSRGNVYQDPMFSFDNIFSSGLSFYLIIGLLSSCLLWAIAFVFGESYIENFADDSNFYFPVLALNGAVLAMILGSPFKAVLIAKKKITLQRKIQLTTSIARLLTSVWALSIFETVSSIFVSYFFTFMLEAFLYALFSRKLFIVKSQKLLDLSPLRNFLPPYIKTVTIRFGGYLIMYSSGMVLAKLDPIEASSYLLTMRLVQALMAISVTPVSVLLPKLSRLRVSKDNTEIIDKSVSLISLGGLIYISGALVLIVLGDYLIEVLSEKSALLPRPLLTIYCLIMFLEFHHVINSMIYETSNRVPFLYISLLSGAAILFLSTFLSKAYGIEGILFSQFIVQALGNNWYPIYLNLKDWGISIIKYIKLLFLSVITFRFLKIIYED